ncbi:Spermidine/putrescine import ABC transporter substrate-binding protein PotD (TC 3.A.1.11.1) [hydrothermal vent metagenome]|uniref:Spermidine/putrescine import ABC transporter substrate-binding protein PotD (TC 3.A.1.11.1) n=1 Tax=hydrothermal vent metagenome TaxID=652676 RepID=A0A3B0WWU7_9ZZZZ
MLGLVTPHALLAEPRQTHKPLRFLNWDTYIGKTTLRDFTQRSGVDVAMDVFTSEADFVAKLLMSNPRYDVAVASDYSIMRLIRAELLTPLNRSLIPNISNINPQFMDAEFDKGRRYSLPYMWGTLGIGYRKSAVKGPVDSWKWLLDSDKYSGRIAVLDEQSTLIQMALKYLGYSINTTNADEIKKAGNLLTKQKPHIKYFAGDNGQDLLRDGEVDLVMEWNGDISQVMEEDDDIAYVVPKEGSLVWQDNLCIPRRAPNVTAAHQFINFIFDAKAGAELAEEIAYATPNLAALELTSESYQKNAAIFPSKEILARCESARYAGSRVSQLYNEAWNQILNGGGNQ